MSTLSLQPPAAAAGELSARATLRAQIAGLERRLGALAYELGRSGRGRALPSAVPGARPGPRILSLGMLEATRDEMIGRVRAGEDALRALHSGESAARSRLSLLLDEPSAHHFARVTLADLGEPGCGVYSVRPRLGLLGILFNWWCVKLSSGCP